MAASQLRVDYLIFVDRLFLQVSLVDALCGAHFHLPHLDERVLEVGWQTRRREIALVSPLQLPPPPCLGDKPHDAHHSFTQFYHCPPFHRWRPRA